MRRKQLHRTMLLGILGAASLLTLSSTAPAWAERTPPGPVSRPCTAASLHGAYAYSRVGTVIDAGPAAANGVVTFDGQGNLAGTDTASVNGVIAQRTFKGDYTVEADCTGAATLAFANGEVVRIALQLIGGSWEVAFIQTDDGTVITGAAKKMLGNFLGTTEETPGVLSQQARVAPADPAIIPGPVDYVLCVLACYEYVSPPFNKDCPIFCAALLP